MGFGQQCWTELPWWCWIDNNGSVCEPSQYKPAWSHSSYKSLFTRNTSEKRFKVWLIFSCHSCNL